MTARFAPVDIAVDLAALPPNERLALGKMIEAAKIFDALFLRQVSPLNETLLAELVRGDGMNRLGRSEYDDHELVVDPTTTPPITFNEEDVNILAQAKGANVAGLQIIFQQYGIKASELDVFYLAGGFGRHLNLENSKRIGLIPDIPTEKIRQVGNAAVEGACIALLSKTKRSELEQLVRRVEHCRLETHPNFFDVFVEGCQFAPFQTTPTN